MISAADRPTSSSYSPASTCQPGDRRSCGASSDLLHDELGFERLVTSDLAAVSQLHTKHAVAEDAVHAVAQAIRAGVALDLDNRVSTAEIVEAVHSGVLDERELDGAVAQVLRAKFEIGLFENPYVEVDAVPETLDGDSSRALARRMAEQSVILLQNAEVDGSPLLPFDPGLRTIAVIGPNADRPLGQLGNYSYRCSTASPSGSRPPPTRRRVRRTSSSSAGPPPTTPPS